MKKVTTNQKNERHAIKKHTMQFCMMATKSTLILYLYSEVYLSSCKDVENEGGGFYLCT